MNKFLPMYCSVNYLTKKIDKLQIKSASTQKTFTMETKTKRGELNLQILKVS